MWSAQQHIANLLRLSNSKRVQTFFVPIRMLAYWFQFYLNVLYAYAYIYNINNNLVKGIKSLIFMTNITNSLQWKCITRFTFNANYGRNFSICVYDMSICICTRVVGPIDVWLCAFLYKL